MESKVQWTQNQQDAIFTRKSNLLVAAAAGSGKTAVLVERIIQMIIDSNNPIDIDRLLVVTFTKAAASEMKERIGEAIAKQLEDNPKDKRLQQQLVLLNKASVTTIHSFCLEVIRSHFYLIDLDPNFRVGDMMEINLLKSEALEELFEEKYSISQSYEKEERIDGFIDLVESYSGKREDRQFRNMVLTLYDFVKSSPWVKEWLEEKAELFHISEEKEIDDLLWIQNIKEIIKMDLEGIKDVLIQGLKICQKPQGPLGYKENFLEDLDKIQVLIDQLNLSFMSAYETFQEMKWTSLSRKKQECDEALKEKAKTLRDTAKKSLEKIMSNVFFKHPEGLLRDLEILYPRMKALGQVVLEFDEKFKQKKKGKNIIDFNDIEHYCLQILMEVNEENNTITPSFIAQEYQNKFMEVLIDEYQDSNYVQETLLSLISRKNDEVPNLFMVGDVKQSIYRFRLAKPELFMEKYNTYSHEENARNRRIDLDQNFRSRKEVLYGINFIFDQIMSSHVGELEYDEKAGLYPGADYPKLENDIEFKAGGAIELHLIEKNKEESLEESEEVMELDYIQVEAKIIANRIKELMQNKDREFQVFDKHKKEYRSVRYKDIVILLRATQNWAPIFVEELLKENIPAYADTSTGYFEAIEIQTMIGLLQIIDNPRQDIPLLAVLRSPIVGLRSYELTEIKVVSQKEDFYDCLYDFLENMEKQKEESFNKKVLKTKEIKEDLRKENSFNSMNSLRDQVKKFLEDLEKWRHLSKFLSVDELIQTLYTDTNYYHYVGALPGGIQRQANLRTLVTRASQFEATSFKGIFLFLQLIEKIKYENTEMGIAKIVGENENVVRIMSIHKSKGLEFPVVFVAGAGKQFNLMDMNGSLLFHQDLGFGPLLIDYEKRIKYSTLPRISIREKLYYETLSEEMRVLYVALTRAKEKLIIVGSDKKIKEKCELWCRYTDYDFNKLPPYFTIKAKSYLDWICPALSRHKDGLWLREQAQIVMEPFQFKEERSNWKIKYHCTEDIKKDVLENESLEEKAKDILSNPDFSIYKSQYKEEVFKRLSWTYPYEKEVFTPTKVTVTELKKIQEEFFMEEEDSFKLLQESLPAKKQEFRKPKFMSEEKKYSAAEKGSLLHTVLQHLDFRYCKEKEDIQKLILDLVENELITKEQSEVISISKIKLFIESNLGKRMEKANKLYREVPFMMETEYQDCNEVLLQGVIDCYFEEDGEIVLVDYKTDFVVEGEEEKIEDRYSIQIEYYTKALENILNKKVKQRYLYLFSINKEIEM